ncbi:enoyl-CoA hydratase-related protein [Alloalcanivorax xenomutans]|uniref:Enoyl-CoA hydratase-related protein n=1 Tax=Alloalcanivorax xenomutans TaxID=1094342 RepID=A0A9Q3W859_9GAMM|nr:enoyl-CoA hydratase-related protein [Alloalcanivorax xenomutans]ARB47162.1 enoyl-CoA hydratase [Alloalcanivorax xenomutans]MCE7510804.1 enoyl-CoA hydratase-related protein [Alloalcanivorax xenomutans]MCE7525319.1 enoyl-CoA hydratase-related protein [Alloalcanivorax xenomutans]
MSKAVTFELVEHHIALVTLNRPEARNAVNGDVAAQLEAIVERTNEDPAIRACILTGAGDQAFCAGADLKAVKAGLVATLRTEKGNFAGFVTAPRHKPWIAAVNGFALGGGCEMVLACDMAVADPGARLGLPEVKRGLMALAGGLVRLPRAIPRAIAFEVIATGEPLSAQRAREAGLVNTLSAPGQVVETALDLARKVIANSPIAVQESLRIARNQGELSEPELLAAGMKARAELEKTHDYAEGLRAFAEKRLPDWQGR